MTDKKSKRVAFIFGESTILTPDDLHLLEAYEAPKPWPRRRLVVPVFTPAIDPTLLRQAIETWGKEAQVRMTIEECGELITALAQHLRGRQANTPEEVADVLIMASQMRLLFDPAEVDRIIEAKMKRLRFKLKKAEIKVYRDGDGWPICPGCGQDELWSRLSWNGEGERPPVTAYIEAGLSCYACGWKLRPLKEN